MFDLKTITIFVIVSRSSNIFIVYKIVLRYIFNYLGFRRFRFRKWFSDVLLSKPEVSLHFNFVIKENLKRRICHLKTIPPKSDLLSVHRYEI